MQKSIESISLLPVNYFPLEFDCHYVSPRGKLSKKHEIPLASDLCLEKAFASVSLGWNEEGFQSLVKVKKSLEQSHFPDVEYGDSIELFIDTRNIKSAGFNHRFCHHFVFLAEAIEGVQAREVTRFRTEDVHPLCEPKDLEVKVSCHKTSYDMFLKIPASCLHGFDAGQFNRLGFTYRINRCGEAPQHFSLHSAEYQIDQNPALFSTMRLIK